MNSVHELTGLGPDTPVRHISKVNICSGWLVAAEFYLLVCRLYT